MEPTSGSADTPATATAAEQNRPIGPDDDGGSNSVVYSEGPEQPPPRGGDRVDDAPGGSNSTDPARATKLGAAGAGTRDGDGLAPIHWELTSAAADRRWLQVPVIKLPFAALKTIDTPQSLPLRDRASSQPLCRCCWQSKLRRSLHSTLPEGALWASRRQTSEVRGATTCCQSKGQPTAHRFSRSAGASCGTRDLPARTGPAAVRARPSRRAPGAASVAGRRAYGSPHNHAPADPGKPGVASGGSASRPSTTWQTKAGEPCL